MISRKIHARTFCIVNIFTAFSFFPVDLRRTTLTTCHHVTDLFIVWFKIDHIQIHQKVELVKASVGFDMKNQYKIKNSQGQKIYKAKEENDYCTKNCCGSLRSFVMKISDYSDREVIRLIRPFRCMSCCCPCCLQEMEVQAPPGTTIGYVKQDWHPFLPKVSIQGPNKETLMKIEGPCCVSYCCGDVNYEVGSEDCWAVSCTHTHSHVDSRNMSGDQSGFPEELWS
uniref:Phospholipid scramblase n=1 Tax=Gouania willdenowi TaxID=441366 RepID=A0A8C5GPZ7_GOUWI